MKIKLGYSMGYAGTDTEWAAEVPEEVVAMGKEAIEDYLEEERQFLFEHACDKISVWAEIVE